MKTKPQVWVMTLIIALAVTLGMAQGVSALSASDQLPATKDPSSAKFDMSGSIKTRGTGQDSSILISGSGQMAKDKLQMDVTLTAPDVQPSPGNPNTFTMSMIVLDQKMYFRLTGLSTQGEDKWYVSDLTSSGGGLMPGMGAGTTALDPKLAEAFKVTQMGKEAINGAPTTKYRIDVDINKLTELSGGTADASTSQALGNTSMVMYMWVGDNDMYLHRERLEMTVEVENPNGGAPAGVDMDFTITLKDFDMPVNIVAPPNAEPLSSADNSSLGGLTAGIPGASLVGMPIGTGMGMSTGMGIGMPTSGAANYPNLLPLLIMALALVGTGAGLRVRSGRVRV